MSAFVSVLATAVLFVVFARVRPGGGGGGEGCGGGCAGCGGECTTEPLGAEDGRKRRRAEPTGAGPDPRHE